MILASLSLSSDEVAPARVDWDRKKTQEHWSRAGFLPAAGGLSGIRSVLRETGFLRQGTNGQDTGRQREGHQLITRCPQTQACCDHFAMEEARKGTSSHGCQP